MIRKVRWRLAGVVGALAGVGLSLSFAPARAYAASTASECSSILSGQLDRLNQLPFLDAVNYRFGHILLGNLEPIAQMSGLEKEFARELAKTTQGVHARIGLYRDRDPEEQRPHVLLLFELLDTSVSPSRVLGFKAARLIKNPDGSRDAEGDGFYLDPAFARGTGISSGMTAFLEKHVYARMGVRRESLEADYFGRYIWAKRGFRFKSGQWLIDAKTRKRLPLIEATRQCLVGFLTKHGFNTHDLAIEATDGKNPPRPIASLDELLTPQDFARLVDRQGRTVRLQPLLGEEDLGPEADFPIGKAFMLADYRPQPGEPVLVSADRYATVLAKTAMPYWQGERDLKSAP